LAASVVLSGCSFLDQIQINAGPTLDPDKVYLGTSKITASWRELDRYACVGGPLLCEQAGGTYYCRCP
jgi:hypothetical protein